MEQDRVEEQIDSGEEEEDDGDESETEEEFYEADNPAENPVFLPFFRALYRDQAAREDDDSSSGGGSADDLREPFDPALPGQHCYLGAGQELSGRTLLEEGQLITLPLLCMPGFILMPEQVFPLTVFHPAIISMLKNVIADTKTIGVINRGAEAEHWTDLIGTTAEIFEYRDDSDQDLNSVGFKFKAKGRQRFRVLLPPLRSMDGNLLGTVSVIPEVDLSHPLKSLRSRWQRSIDTGKPNELDASEDLPRRRRRLQTTPFPSWVYDMYDKKILVRRVQRELEKCGFSTPGVNIPWDPEQLSWWVAANLPMQDAQKSLLLSINTSVQRLRAELSFLCRGRVLVCKRCDTQLADQRDIFSMSGEGPQGAYINPGGHLHETLTLYRARNLKLLGSPSTDYSWFPGYAWTVLECATCFNHIGWKFTAANAALKPEKFYGFSRQSIRAEVNPLVNDNCGEQGGNLIVM